MAGGVINPKSWSEILPQVEIDERTRAARPQLDALEWLLAVHVRDALLRLPSGRRRRRD